MASDLRTGVHIEIVSGAAALGLRAQFAMGGPRGFSAYQRLRLEPEPRVVGAPAVAEFETASVVEGILRCIPVMMPRPRADQADLGEVSLPWESALLLAADPGGRPAAEVRGLSGWSDLPEALASVLTPLRAWCCAVTSTAQGSRLRQWICGDRGWLELGLDGGHVRLIPISRADMRCSMVSDLAAAAHDSLAGAD